jgi:hypothetical protein
MTMQWHRLHPSLPRYAHIAELNSAWGYPLDNGPRRLGAEVPISPAMRYSNLMTAGLTVRVPPRAGTFVRLPEV